MKEHHILVIKTKQTGIQIPMPLQKSEHLNVRS